MLKSIENYRVEFVDDLTIGGKRMDAYLCEPERILYIDSKISHQRRTSFLMQARNLVRDHKEVNR